MSERDPMNQELDDLKAEVERLNGIYVSAVKGRQEMREGMRKARDENLELRKLLIIGLEIHDEYLSQIATCVSQDYGRLNEFPIRCREKGIALDD